MALFFTRSWLLTAMLLATSVTVLAQTPGISAFSTLSEPIGSTGTITGTEFNPMAAQNVALFGTAQATLTVPATNRRKTNASTALSVDCISTLTVNDLGDGSDATPGNGVCATSGGTCTLRAAIQEANALGACAPLTIDFSVNGTITLGSNLPNITKSVIINGNGTTNTVISGNNLYRSLNSISTNGLNVTIRNLKAANGYLAGNGLGGAIDFDSQGGTLTVDNVVFTNGTAGYGGGISATDGTLLIQNSVITDNTGNTVNGGLFMGSHVTATLVNCLFTGNSGEGGAIFNNAGILKVYNCTVAGNTANSIYAAGIDNNGGTLTIYNSILADNTGSAGNCDGFAGQDIQNTLIKNGSCGIINGVNGNLTGDPGLNPDYTLTANSIAVGAGNNSLLPSGVTADLAGNARIQQGTVDMGAYESAFVRNTAPTITAGAALTRQSGSTGSTGTIATVSDPETTAGSLTVTVTTVPTGITVSDIVNSSGTVLATVTANCNAVVGNNTIVLTVTDANGATATANLTVNVTANIPPALTYGTVSVSAGGSTATGPATASDNGSIVSYSVQSQGSYTGTVTVNSSGVVSFVNAGPVGMHTVLIRATDNCTVFTDAQITVTITCPPVAVSDVTLTQPTCATPTGTAAVNATGSGTLEYSKDDTNWVSSNTFSSLAPANYTFSVRLQSNPTCVATSTQQTINAVPVAPTLTGVTLTQPTCATPTGTAVVNATGSGTLEYSKDGTNWVSSNTFSSLAPANYTFSVHLVANPTCVATSTQQTINAVPVAPTLTGVTLTQPTCATPTGTAVVNATGSGTLEYSKDGTNWVSSNTFSSLAPANYTFSVRLVTNSTCVATSTQQTINTVPAPNATINYAGNPFVNVGTASATLTGNSGGTFSSTIGLSINAATGEINLASSTPGTYTVTYTIAANGSCPQFQTATSVEIIASVRIIYVNVSNAAPDQDGSTWAKAFSSLQAGLYLATISRGQTDGVQVWVAQGTYLPGVLRKDVFEIPSGVEVYGGFVGTETLLSERNWKTHTTTLSGEIGSSSLSDNVNHVVVLNATNAATRLDGFTIEKGFANFVNNVQNTELTEPAILSSGGGVLVINKSRGIITNCIITNNRAIAGGGILLQDSSRVSLTKSVIWGNEATFGGGLYILGSTPRLENLLIVTNKALGGGLYINRSQPLVLHSTIAANQGTGGTAGGIFNVNSTVTIKNSILWGNTSPQTTAGIGITHSIIEGGYAGTGNSGQNPLFVNAGSSGLAPLGGLGDYRLQNCSPAINSGDNTDALVEDLDGNIRPYAAVVDKGAYESQVIGSSGPANLSVTENISSGNVQITAGKITATNQVSGGRVTYQAAQSVTLQPGFSAITGIGTLFQALIGGCP